MPRRLLVPPLALVVALGALAHAAHAAPPARWSAVTAADGSNTDQVGLAREPNGALHVAWTRKTPGHPVNDDLVHTAIAPDGTVGAPQTVVSDWLGVGSPALARARDGSLLIVAGATSSLDPGAVSDFGAWRSSDGGATWVQHPGNAATGGGFADAPALAFGSDGVTPFVAWGTTFGLFVHRGLSDTPATANLQTAAGFGCCGYDPGIAVDGASGQMIVGWYSNADGHEGVFAQPVDQATGAPLQAPSLMPGSVVRRGGSEDSSASLARTPVVARPGRAGVFLAWAGGYPTTRHVVLWRFGGERSKVVATRSAGVANVTLAADPAGRLWAVWSGGTRVYARRSNADASAWGAIVSAPARGGTETIYKLAADAQRDVLDVLGAFAAGGGGVRTWHTQLRPGLTLRARPARLPVGGGGARTVTLTVTDAGAPVAGAKVTLAGASAVTRANGTVTVAVGPFRRRATLTARAVKHGYAAASEKVRVRR